MSLKRTLHRKAVRELLNGNPKPAANLAQTFADKGGVFNCGQTLNRKFKKKVERDYSA